MAESDFITIHLPKTAETVGLLDREMLGLAKQGVRIVNTARGGIIDEDALAWAITEGIVGGAALDVFAEEPTTSSPLFELDSVVVTPHLGASTREAQDKAGDTIAEQVMLALAGEFVPFAVNVSAAEASETVRPYLPLVERLGQLFAELEEGAPTALDVEYQGALADYDTRILTLSALKGMPGCVSPCSGPMTWTIPWPSCPIAKWRMPNSAQLRRSTSIWVRETGSAIGWSMCSVGTL